MSSSSEEDHDLEYQTADSCSEAKESVSCNDIRINSYVLINNRPCRVVELEHSKPGKHGHAKTNISGTDIFTNKRYTACFPSSHNVFCPIINRQYYELINIEGNYTTLMANDGSIREDVMLPTNEETRNRIQSVFEETIDTIYKCIVTTLNWNDESIISEVKRV